MEAAPARFDFHTQDCSFPEDLLDQRTSSEQLERLIRSYGFLPGELNIIFCSDGALQKIHKAYLDEDELTDIITFDHVVGDQIHGDLFISIDRVRSNAKEHGRPEKEELHRVMAHGVLHLLGYKDKGAKELQEMRAAEDEALRAWGF